MADIPNGKISRVFFFPSGFTHVYSFFCNEHVFLVVHRWRKNNLTNSSLSLPLFKKCLKPQRK